MEEFENVLKSMTFEFFGSGKHPLKMLKLTESFRRRQTTAPIPL
jgi:hypothetical protein